MPGGTYICNITTNILEGDDCKTLQTLLMIVPDNDPFVWKISHFGVLFQGDLRSIVYPNRAAGIGRYGVQGTPRQANVVMVPKEGCTKTWGIMVKNGSIIKKGEVIIS
jgi:hypothetical protein